jgi:hypothetical protein
MTKMVCKDCGTQCESDNAMQMVSVASRCECGGQLIFTGSGCVFTNWLFAPKPLATVDDLLANIFEQAD